MASDKGSSGADPGPGPGGSTDNSAARAVLLSVARQRNEAARQTVEALRGEHPQESPDELRFVMRGPEVLRHSLRHARGFLDELLAQFEDEEAIEDVEPGELPATPVTRAGDLWVLGEHRLLCGDSTDTASYERVLADERADLV